MQQGLRPYVQDENAMALHHPPTLHLKGGGGGGAGGANEIGGALKKGTPGFPTVRKALVNITNSKAGFGSGNSDGGAPGKTPAGVRRALGDITNSNMAAPSAQKAAQKALPLAVRPVPTLQQQQPSAMAAVAALPTSRADVLAEGGVERLAGHSWEQLEAGRVAREEAEIQRRLVSLANFPPRALPTFFPFWGAPADRSQQMLEKDVLPTPPASPVAKRPLAAGSALNLSVPDLGDLSLPDIALPDIDDSMELAGLDDS